MRKRRRARRSAPDVNYAWHTDARTIAGCRDRPVAGRLGAPRQELARSRSSSGPRSPRSTTCRSDWIAQEAPPLIAEILGQLSDPGAARELVLSPAARERAASLAADADPEALRSGCPGARGAPGAADRGARPRAPGAGPRRVRARRRHASPRSSARSRRRRSSRWSARERGRAEAAGAIPSTGPRRARPSSERVAARSCSPRTAAREPRSRSPTSRSRASSGSPRATATNAAGRMMAAVAGVLSGQLAGAERAFRIGVGQLVRDSRPAGRQRDAVELATRVADVVERSQSDAGPRVCDHRRARLVPHSTEPRRRAARGGRGGGLGRPCRTARIAARRAGSFVARSIDRQLDKTCGPANLRKTPKARDLAMSGIRTAAAAEMLGVSPSTLRTWERRLGYPQPRRTPGNHRQYELERDRGAARRAARDEQHLFRRRGRPRRGRGPSSPARLSGRLRPLRRGSADRELEESLAVRTARAHARGGPPPRARHRRPARTNGEAELEYACRWATGWLHGARSLAPPASRPAGRAAARFGPAARPRGGPRPGARALPPQGRPARPAPLRRPRRAPLRDGASRARPRAVVLCGAEARLDVLGEPLRRAMRAGGAAPFSYRSARLVGGRDGHAQPGHPARARPRSRLLAALAWPSCSASA